MRSIANRVLGIEREDDDVEIKDPSEKPYKSIYIEPTKEIIVDRDTRVCYLVNRVGGIVMMTNSDGTPKLYEGDLDDVKKQVGILVRWLIMTIVTIAAILLIPFIL